MAEETVGYVELEWVCKSCTTRNGGTQKVCLRCGSPMGEREQFLAPADQQLLTGQAALDAASGAPDFHCYYCGARNKAGAAACERCNADLTQARARASGANLGELRSGPAPDIVCSHCRTANPASAHVCRSCNAPLGAARAVAPAAAKKSNAAAIILGVIAVVAFGIVALLVLAFRTKDSYAVVQSVAWERQIVIAEQRPSQKSDWADEIPAGAQRGSCTKKVRKTQSQPAPDAEKVCDKPKMVDQGNGTAKVVQSCEYKISDQWCEFTVTEWKDVDKAVAKGSDLNPKWPEPRLRAGQREGKRTEDYKVFFKGDGAEHTYTTDKASEFSRFAAGSKWVLKVNTFGTVNEVTPAK